MPFEQKLDTEAIQNQGVEPTQDLVLEIDAVNEAISFKLLEKRYSNCGVSPIECNGQAAASTIKMRNEADVLKSWQPPGSTWPLSAKCIVSQRAQAAGLILSKVLHVDLPTSHICPPLTRYIGF
jgi:hypothetical protein